MIKTKRIEKIIEACIRSDYHKFYCDKFYVANEIKCKYHGKIVHVLSFKNGIKGYQIRYECKKQSKT